MEFVLDGATNFRSLAGIATTDNRRVRPNVLFRSDELSRLTDADWQWLRDANLVAICDLRRRDERQVHPTKVPADMSANITEYWWPFDDEILASMHGMIDHIRQAMASLADAPDEVLEAWTQKQYARYGAGFAQLAPHIREVFNVILKHNGQGAVLIHCGAGKDRTGWAIASVLHAIGVDRDAILDDYVLTNEGYLARPPPREHLQPLLACHGLDALSQRVLDRMCIAHREAMAEAFNYLTATYGSLDGFLEGEIKLTAEERATLREILTA